MRAALWWAAYVTLCLFFPGALIISAIVWLVMRFNK